MGDKSAVTAFNEGTVHQLLLNAILTVRTARGTVWIWTPRNSWVACWTNILAKKNVTVQIQCRGLSQADGVSYKAPSSIPVTLDANEP
jgi:hypothetical protein